MRVARWGNSLAVRIPRALVEELSLKEGDEVCLVGSSRGQLLVTPDDAGTRTWAEMEALSRPLPPGYGFDRDDANDR